MLSLTAAGRKVTAAVERWLLEGEVSNDLLQRRGLLAEILYLAGGRRTRRVSCQPAFAGLQEPLGPAVVRRGGDALAVAQPGDVLLAPQPLQHDMDLFLYRIMPALFGAECPSILFLPALCPTRISASSSLLTATMNQKSSIREVPQSVSQVPPS
jgi:hypothetical protein